MSRTRGGRQRRSDVDRRAAERRGFASSSYAGPVDRRVIERRAAERRTIGLGSLNVRRWTVMMGVAAIALGAGVLVAGVPKPSDGFVLPDTAVASTEMPADDGPAATTATSPVTDATDATEAAEATEATEATPPETTEAPMSSTTEAATTTDVVVITVGSTTTDVLVPPGQLDLVFANGSGESGLATRTARMLTGVGYPMAFTTDSAQPSDETVIYYADGFQEEAAILAADLNAPDARLVPKPVEPVTVDGSGADADLVVVLGPSS